MTMREGIERNEWREFKPAILITRRAIFVVCGRALVESAYVRPLEVPSHEWELLGSYDASISITYATRCNES